MKHWDTEIFEFGEKDNKIVHVSNVPNGLKCECVCPYCKDILVAANNIKSENLRPYFRHYSKNCDHKLCQETVIHLMAKDIIEEQGYINLPIIKYSYSGYLRNFITSIDPDETLDINKPPKYIDIYYFERKVPYESIRVEQKVRQIKPDIHLTINDKPLVVEIAYTHFCDELKLNKLIQNKTNAIEIDISGLKRNAEKTEISKSLNRIRNVKWLYNEKKLLFLRKMVENAIELRDFIFTNAETKQTYAGLSRIYKCPLRKLKQEEYITVENECEKCDYFLGLQEKVNYEKEMFNYEKKMLEEKGEDTDFLYEKFGQKIYYKVGEITCAGNLKDKLEKIYNG